MPKKVKFVCDEDRGTCGKVGGITIGFMPEMGEDGVEISVQDEAIRDYNDDIKDSFFYKIARDECVRRGQRILEIIVEELASTGKYQHAEKEPPIPGDVPFVIAFRDILLKDSAGKKSVFTLESEKQFDRDVEDAVNRRLPEIEALSNPGKTISLEEVEKVLLGAVGKGVSDQKAAAALVSRLKATDNSRTP